MRTGANMNRRGRFVLTFDFFEQDLLNFEQKICIFERILIIESRTNFANQTIEYIGISDLFEENSENMIIPAYDCILSTDDQNRFLYTWKRIE